MNRKNYRIVIDSKNGINYVQRRKFLFFRYIRHRDLKSDMFEKYGTLRRLFQYDTVSSDRVKFSDINNAVSFLECLSEWDEKNGYVKVKNKKHISLEEIYLKKSER